MPLLLLLGSYPFDMSYIKDSINEAPIYITILVILKLLVTALLLSVFIVTSVGSVEVTTYIPPKAKALLPILRDTIEEIYPEHEDPAYFASLIEHESCVSLRSKRCWSPKSRFKTKREEGGGLGQLTRVWRKNGKLRFDKLQELRNKHKEYLRDLRWNNLYTRPDLQLKAVVLLVKDLMYRLPSHLTFENKMAFADSAYNGGYRGVIKDRRYCGLVKGCDPDIWFDNVETHSVKSRKILYGRRSAFSINRHHVKDVLKTRINKYRFYFLDDQLSIFVLT